MSQAGPLRWRDGQGWLLLVGGGELNQLADIDRAAVDLMSDELPAIFVAAASPTPEQGREYGERVLAQIERLGGPAGYIAPLFSRAEAADPRNVRRLSQAGLIYLGDGNGQQLVETLAETPALDALAAAYESGAVIVAEGQAARAFGVPSPSDSPGDQGWGWLPDALIYPHLDDAAAATLRKAVKLYAQGMGLGIPDGTALALGPEGQVQTFSPAKKQVTVILGPKFASPGRP